MRTIKFRAQDFTGTWQYGFLAKGKESAVIMPIREDGSVLVGFNFYVKPETIGQYTGLNDKDGKEIYEGDILDVVGTDDPERSFRSKVFWRNGAFAIYFYEECHESIMDYAEDKDTELTVIGNIYDNPELLEQ